MRLVTYKLRLDVGLTRALNTWARECGCGEWKTGLIYDERVNNLGHTERPVCVQNLTVADGGKT
jgi:hypothetical protein